MQSPVSAFSPRVDDLVEEGVAELEGAVEGRAEGEATDSTVDRGEAAKAAHQRESVCARRPAESSATRRQHLGCNRDRNNGTAWCMYTLLFSATH